MLILRTIVWNALNFPTEVQYSSNVDPSPYENISLQAWARESNVYVVLETMWLGSLLDVITNGEQPLFHHHPEAACFLEGRSQAQTTALPGKHCNEKDDEYATTTTEVTTRTTRE